MLYKWGRKVKNFNRILVLSGYRENFNMRYFYFKRSSTSKFWLSDANMNFEEYIRISHYVILVGYMRIRRFSQCCLRSKQYSNLVHSLWVRKRKLDKVVMVKLGVFLVIFMAMDSRDKVFNGHFSFIGNHCLWNHGHLILILRRMLRPFQFSFT